MEKTRRRNQLRTSTIEPIWFLQHPAQPAKPAGGRGGMSHAPPAEGGAINAGANTESAECH
jgi:hypothetical protein